MVSNAEKRELLLRRKLDEVTRERDAALADRKRLAVALRTAHAWQRCGFCGHLARAPYCSEHIDLA
jgi:hypothetical protein